MGNSVLNSKADNAHNVHCSPFFLPCFMPLIHIHISRPTKRMIESRYGKETPLNLKRSDLLYHQLHFRLRDESKTNFAKAKKLLTERIQINISPEVYQFLSKKKRYVRVGLFLHKIFLEEMNQFIDALGDLGESNMGALKLFREKHDIGEDDFGLDSSYKNWQRYQIKKYGKKNKNHCTKKSDNVLQKNTECATAKNQILWTDIVAAVNGFYHCGRENLFLKNQTVETPFGIFEKKFDTFQVAIYAHARHVMYYLIHEHCDFSSRKIAELFPQSYRTVAYGIAQIRDQVTLYESLQYEITEIEKNLKV